MLMFLFGLFAVTQLLAQSRTVKGVVTDESGKPIANASVIVKGTNTGTTTNSDGEYTITVNSSARILVISSVNFATLEANIQGKSVANISLKASTENLDEVVVVGYQTQRKREVTASIAKVSGAEIGNLPVQSFDRAIQGRAAGVNVQSTNGIPGGPVQVRIRGIGSLTAGNDPLYIVDGVQMNSNVSTFSTQTNPLAFLNPADIESVEILKDAAAAAIYGARAGNGVILVTTKAGKRGKTKITGNVYTGAMSPLKIFNVTNTAEYLGLRMEAYQYANPTTPAATIRSTVLAELGLPSTTTNEQIAELRSTDWQREVFRDGTVKNVELGVSGGNDKTLFNISGSYNKTDAIIKPVNFERTTLMSKLSHKLTDKFNIDVQLNVSSILQNSPFAVSGSFLGSPAFSSSLLLPYNPIYNADGSFYGMPGSVGQPFYGILNQNVVGVAAYNTGDQRTNQFVGSIKTGYEFLKNLKYSGTYGLDYRLVQSNNYRDPRTNDGFGVRGRATVASNWNSNFTTNHIVNYNNQFKGGHNVNAIAGLEFRKDMNEQLNATGIGFATPDFRTANAAATPETIGGFWTASTTFSTFAKVNYDFMRKYLLALTFRRDGSSRFGANNLYANFYSVSAGWNLKQENFLKGANNINDLKLRASYGQTGNDQIGNFDSRGLYGSGRIYNNAPAINPTQLANPDLRWETREEWNLGLDFGFFRNRVNGSIDYYSRKNNDLLLNRPIYQTTGFTSITQNLGSMLNRGIELQLNVKLVESKDFNWETRFNISYNHNEVLSLYDNLKSLPSNNAIAVGQANGAVFTQRYAGVNPATGRPVWYDINGNYTYSVLAADRVFIKGNTNIPSYQGGLNNSISYKNFELDAFFNYEYGKVVSDGQVNFLSEIGGRAFNALRTVMESRWTKPGDITSVTSPALNNAFVRSSGFISGDRQIFKTDYIRLKQITLSYNFPKAMLTKLGASAMKFYIQGINLWTYTDYIGYDPEFVGTSTGIIPQSKNVTFGVQFTF